MDINDLSQAVLDQRRQKGQTNGYLASLASLSKRLVARYELVASGTEFDSGSLEQTLEELHRDCEEGRLGKTSFARMRRMAADMEDVAEFGVIGDSPIAPWGEFRNPLNRPLTEEEKLDPDSIAGLAARTLDLLAAAGMAPHQLLSFRRHFLRKLLLFFAEHGEERYSEELMGQYLDHLDSLEYEQNPEVLFHMRQAARDVRSVHYTGALYERKGPGYVESAMSGPFADLLCEYGQWVESDAGLYGQTARLYVLNAACFLEALRRAGLDDLSLLTRDLFRSARSAACDGLAEGAACNRLLAIRSFAAFAEQRHPEIPAFKTWVGCGPKRRRKMPTEGYTREQADAVTSSIDPSKPAGQRDLAIATLAKNTGVRGCDIRRLRRSDIDWRARTITIVQSKTGRPLALPLDTETGTAIASYLLGPREERGELDDLVFLTVSGEVGPLTRTNINKRVRFHAIPALGDGFGGPHGTHSFRRGVGAEMVGAGVPLADVSEFLGHASVKSTGPYVAVAFERLRVCAAGLGSAPAERIWWLK